MPVNAAAYPTLLNREVFRCIERRPLSGYSGIELLRRDLPNEVGFVTIMTYQSLDGVIRFQGADYEQCQVQSVRRQTR